MKEIILFLAVVSFTLWSETLFQVKDSSDNVVLDVASDGLRIFNEGDTLMVISSGAIKAFIDQNAQKGLARSFSVTSSTNIKAGQANVMEVTTDATTMREGNAGERYTDFSPENMFLGLNAGVATAPSGTTSGQNNIFIGNEAGLNNNSGYKNIFIGAESGMNNTDSYDGMFIGYKAGYNNAATSNLFIGNFSGETNTSGSLNTYLGHYTGVSHSSGTYNTYVGYSAGANKTGGNYNTFIGTLAGRNNGSGSSNVFIGNGAGGQETGSGKLYIANNNTPTPLIYGDFNLNELTVNGRLNAYDNEVSGYFEASAVSGDEHVRGLYGKAYNGTITNYGIFATASGTGATNYAGYFSGNINVTGTVVKSKDEVISDHPTDPENKILTHSSVSSSEMLNVYSGNVILDGDGFATVEMPDWFQAYNAEFRYQLTGIGSSAPGLYISDELDGGRFGIGGGNPGMKVSWMVTAVRNDNYAKSNPVKIETSKTADQRGYYLHPESFGLSEERGIEYEIQKREESERENK